MKEDTIQKKKAPSKLNQNSLALSQHLCVLQPPSRALSIPNRSIFFRCLAVLPLFRLPFFSSLLGPFVDSLRIPSRLYRIFLVRTITTTFLHFLASYLFRPAFCAPCVLAFVPFLLEFLAHIRRFQLNCNEN